MKAQNLTISIPNAGCLKNCPYCISKMTGYMKSDKALMIRNFPKVMTVAKAAGVTSVLITGKGEPLRDMESTVTWVKRVSASHGQQHHYHSELQTNGRGLSQQKIDVLQTNGLNVIAFSFDKLSDFEEHARNAAYIRKRGMLTRASLNITDTVPGDTHFKDILKLTKKYGYHQLTLRDITIPTGLRRTKEAKAAASWVKKHIRKNQFAELLAQLLDTKSRVIRTLPYGAIVYDIQGVAVTAFDYCVQDTNDNDDIRSLILMEDGHLYTSWNSKASILF